MDKVIRESVRAALGDLNVAVGDSVHWERLHELSGFEPPCAVQADVDLGTKFRIGAFSHLNGGFVMNVTIGRYCSLARDIQIGHGSHPTDWLSVSPLQYNPGYRGWPAGDREVVHPDFQWSEHTTIGNDVWPGNHVFVKDGVAIGDGAIVGAGSVVTRDVPPYAIVAGSPARLIRMRFEDVVIERLLKSQWWRHRLSDFGPLDYANVNVAIDKIEERLAGGDLAVYEPGWIGQRELIALSGGLGCAAQSG